MHRLINLYFNGESIFIHFFSYLDNRSDMVPSHGKSSINDVVFNQFLRYIIPFPKISSPSRLLQTFSDHTCLLVPWIRALETSFTPLSSFLKPFTDFLMRCYHFFLQKIGLLPNIDTLHCLYKPKLSPNISLILL